MRFEKPCAEMHAFFGLGCFITILGSILYWHTVVGGNTYFTCTKMGVGKRPDATFWGTYRAKIFL